MTKRRVWGLAGTLILAIAGSGCGGGGGGTSGPSSTNPPPPPPAATFTASGGIAQKGPLIQGSVVTAQELSATLVPTGNQYSYQTTSDFGQFNPSSTFTSQYIGVSASGNYFDESVGAVSAGPITLNSYSDLSSGSVLNVNLLTTLAYQRIHTLVTSSGMTFAVARNQAEREVLAALHIQNAGTLAHFDALDLSKTTDGDKILAAVSALFTQGNSSANLAALIASVQSDIGTNGKITSNATNAILTASAHAMNPTAVAANLTTRYASQGITFSASDIGNWIDSDGDGVASKFEFRVTDASQSSTFTLPSSVTNPNAGASVSVSSGRMTVNGTAVAGATTLQNGDVVALGPPVGTFPSGSLDLYLMSGTTRIAKVSFVSGLVSIAVTPTNPAVAKGLQQQMTATGTFTDGSTADLTSAVTWSSSATATASVSGSGVAAGLAIGLTTIGAQSGSISGSTSMNVVAPELTSISIDPNPIAVGELISRQLTATAHYSDGSSANYTPNATWTTGNAATATVTAGLVTGVLVGNTTVMAASGSISGTATVNVTFNHWNAMPSIGVRTGHTATQLQNGKVIVAFGQGSGPCCNNEITIYDPVTNSWSPGPSIVEGIHRHAAALMPDGRVLLTGGYTNGGANLLTYIYNPATNTLSNAASLPQPRDSAKAFTQSGGKVLVVGSDGANLYDPATNSWASAGNLATPRSGATITLLPQDQVIVVGGSDNSGPLSSAEIWDPLTNSWSSAGNMSQPRVGHAATYVPLLGGFLLVTGGGVAGSTATAEKYSFYSWSPVASMGTPRSGHFATATAYGYVLVGGGDTGASGTPSSSETYDPSTNTWTPAATMLGASSQQVPMALLNTAVLAIGGTTGINGIYW